VNRKWQSLQKNLEEMGEWDSGGAQYSGAI